MATFAGVGLGAGRRRKRNRRRRGRSGRSYGDRKVNIGAKIPPEIVIDGRKYTREEIRLRPFLLARSRPVRGEFARFIAPFMVAAPAITAFGLFGGILIYIQRVLGLLPLVIDSTPYDLLAIVFGFFIFSVMSSSLGRYKAGGRAFNDAANAVGSATVAIVEFTSQTKVADSTSKSAVPVFHRSGGGRVEEQRSQFSSRITIPGELSGTLEDFSAEDTLDQLKFLLATVGYAIKNKFREGDDLDVNLLPLPRELAVELDLYDNTMLGISAMITDRFQNSVESGVTLKNAAGPFNANLDAINNADGAIENVLNVGTPSVINNLVMIGAIIWLGFIALRMGAFPPVLAWFM